MSLPDPKIRELRDLILSRITTAANMRDDCWAADNKLSAIAEMKVIVALRAVLDWIEANDERQATEAKP